MVLPLGVEWDFSFEIECVLFLNNDIVNVSVDLGIKTCVKGKTFYETSFHGRGERQ